MLASPFASSAGAIAVLCYILAAVCFLLGWLHVDVPKGAALNWLCGGLFFITVGLLLVPLL